MAISLVQSNQHSGTGTASTFTATLLSGATLGNLLVVALSNKSNTATITGPARWTQAVIDTASANAVQVSLWWLVVGASDAGATSFTWTMSAAVVNQTTIEEWNSTNGWPVGPVDQTAIGNATGNGSTTMNAGATATTTAASELWVAAISYTGSAQTESSITAGWTRDKEATLNLNTTLTQLYEVPGATGVATCSYTVGTARAFVGAVVTFKDNAPSITYGQALGAGVGGGRASASAWSGAVSTGAATARASANVWPAHASSQGVSGGHANASVWPASSAARGSSSGRGSASVWPASSVAQSASGSHANASLWTRAASSGHAGASALASVLTASGGFHGPTPSATLQDAAQVSATLQDAALPGTTQVGAAQVSVTLPGVAQVSATTDPTAGSIGGTSYL